MPIEWDLAKGRFQGIRDLMAASSDRSASSAELATTSWSLNNATVLPWLATAVRPLETNNLQQY